MAHIGENHMVATLIMGTIFIISDVFNELAKLLRICSEMLTEVIPGDNTQMRVGVTTTEYFAF